MWILWKIIFSKFNSKEAHSQNSLRLQMININMYVNFFSLLQHFSVMLLKKKMVKLFKMFKKEKTLHVLVIIEFIILLLVFEVYFIIFCFVLISSLLHKSYFYQTYINAKESFVRVKIIPSDNRHFLKRIWILFVAFHISVINMLICAFQFCF